MISWAWLQYHHASDIAVGFAQLFGTISPDPPHYPVLQIEPTNCQSQLCLQYKVKSSVKVSKSRQNSQTKLREPTFSIQIRANIDICLCCLFQHLVFSERWEILVTDGVTDRQHDYSIPQHNNRLISTILIYRACIPYWTTLTAIFYKEPSG